MMQWLMSFRWLVVKTAVFAVVLVAPGCGEEEPVGGFLVFREASRSCDISLSPPQAVVTIGGRVDNIAGDKAVNITATATFYTQPHGSQYGEAPVCTASKKMNDIGPLSDEILVLQCIVNSTECPLSYILDFPNNNYLGNAGPI